MSVEDLAGLLEEAEAIPVKMREHQLLVCEIRARQWSDSVQDKFTLGSGLRTLDELRRLLKEAEDNRAAGRGEDGAEGVQVNDQELRLTQILETAERWCARVKTACAAKNVVESQLKLLLEECSKIPVDLGKMKGHLQNLSDKSSQWKEANAALIATCAAVAEGVPPATKIAMSALEVAITSGDKVGVALPELKNLKAVLSTGRDW